MLNLFIASKHSVLPNYIFLFLKGFTQDQRFRLLTELNKNIDLLIIDIETISPQEAKKYVGNYPTLLFTRKIIPFVVRYTSLLDINGIISLDMEPEDISKTLEESLKGEIFYHNEMISILFSPQINELAEKVAAITNREIDIVKLMLKDKTNEEIASELGLSIRTVNAHKGNIMRKIGSKTTSGMVKAIMDYFPIDC